MTNQEETPEKLEEKTPEIIEKVDNETSETMEKSEEETPETMKRHEDTREVSVYSEEAPVIIGEDETINDSQKDKTKNNEALCDHREAAEDDNVPNGTIPEIMIYKV